MKITITEPERNIVIEDCNQAEAAVIIGKIYPDNHVMFLEPRPHDFSDLQKSIQGDQPKKIKPDWAGKFIKENPHGIIAAFAKKDIMGGEILILTKNFAGTGRYIFLTLSSYTSNGNCYTPENEPLDMVIREFNKNFDIYGFKDELHFYRYCIEYKK